MSFITKRERVFNEYIEPYDLPPRNEGKLKAYSSCTDARAWSHFVSDKSEHLCEIIKRNNEICRGKYVPVNVIIEMMMAAKNAEIARLKRKIGQLEQMLSVYDQLDLSCEQKCEISTAHAMIKAATKSLDELPALELDMSGFTEGIDSERFQTGKSGGDDASKKLKEVEWVPGTGHGEKSKGEDEGGLGMESLGFGPFGFDLEGYKSMGMGSKASKASKMNQSDLAERCSCDASTSAHDIRVEELEEALISKDAKLNAMQNTIAVMENDVCEPYCVYAHIYTALEKIYGTLRQNEKYRLFLDLMSSGKDIRCLDIKGKILFKIKILEKFSIALISPCSERFKYDESCECYAAEVETSFAFTQPETQISKPTDVIRSQLIADIMENDDIKEFVTKDLPGQPSKAEERAFDFIVSDNYSIDTENLGRIKALQIDYEDLMNSYEIVKHERDNLLKRCQNYETLEKELEDCRIKLREYNLLYNEREYYRKRSEDIDSLKEQYMVLADETSSLETQLKAEAEINSIKSGTIDELRSDNMALEQKLNDLTIAFEKEKNAVLCKLKEAECKIMCQEQQIRSLSSQIDRILEQDHDKQRDGGVMKSAAIIDEIEALKDQIKSLNNALNVSEDEKQQLQEQFEDKLKLINDLKIEIEEWKSTCEKTLQRNEYHLEQYTEGFRDEIRRIVEENKILSEEVEDKTRAVANLINVINNKSLEINKLIHDIEMKKEENGDLKKQLQETKDAYGSTMLELNHEKKKVMQLVETARQESTELLKKVKDYDDLLHKKEDISKSLALETESCNELRNMLVNAIEDNKKLQQDLCSQENNNSILLQEIQRLRDINDYAVDNINSLQSDKDQYKTSLELTKKESKILEDKLKKFDDLQDELNNLKLSHERLRNDKDKLENELQSKARYLEDTVKSMELTKKESEHLLEKVQHSENLKEDLIKLSKDYQKLVNEQQVLQKDLMDKDKELSKLRNDLLNLKAENKTLLQKAKNAAELEVEYVEFKKTYENLVSEKNVLQRDFANQTQEINNLDTTLKSKIEENRALSNQLKSLERQHVDSITKLEDVNIKTQSTLYSVRRESEELINKLKNYESLLNEYEKMKRAYDQIQQEKRNLQLELEERIGDLKILQGENDELQRHNHDILIQNEDLEKALIDTRNELIKSSENPFIYADVVKEIDEMKEEKITNNIKIKELLEKLDESDNTISNLNENLLASDDKIATLQNYINSLEEEMRRLHQSLAEVVDTGEQIKDNTNRKFDQTLHKIEAHHSKATHNMKMELAKLQNVNAKLEEQLSITKIKSDESLKDKHKYVSQIMHLQNEREIIVKDIKQLEVNCVGDSILSPISCSVEDVLRSLDKIRKCIDARNSKSSSLEQTILKVQTSSQLLLSKADEAKKLVEKEKQKVINEKEEAIADKLNMENQLLDLKLQLEEQTERDKKVIEDLKGEILNQQLIIDKLNASTKPYITRLEKEMQSLQDVYQNSITKIAELQDKVNKLSEENDKYVSIFEKVNMELTEKSKQVSSLQKVLDDLKNKPVKNIDVQAEISSKKKNSKTQTDETMALKFDGEFKDVNDKQKPNVLKVNKQSQSKDVKSSDIALPLNEVQILTANVEPTIDFVKSYYIDYKKKRLGPVNLENVSIITTTGESSSHDVARSSNLVDIFNRQSDMQTVSSKNEKLEGASESGSAGRETKGQTTSSNFTGFGLTQENSNTKYQNEYLSPKAGPSSDKDLFLIYQDSGSSHADNRSFNEKNINKIQRAILVEAVTMHQTREYVNDLPTSRLSEQRPTSQDEKLHDKENIQDRQKILLDVKMPTIPTESTSDMTYTDVSKQLQVEEKTLLKKREPTFINSESERRLSRVEADFILIKNEENQQKQSHKDFGLEYILDSIKYEITHPPENTGDLNKKIHKCLSDDLYQQSKTNSGYGPSNQKPLNAASSFSKTTSLDKWSDSKHLKPVAEQGIMVNIDAPEYYEKKIQSLSQKLENTEKECKKKIDAIKIQYDQNIKGIINEHNQGVKSIQILHEETLQDVKKIHENEVESLRSMSIEAMRQADKLERENRHLKNKIQKCSCECVGIDEEPIKICSPELKKRRSRCRGTKMLTKTNIEAFNVKPKVRSHGPCSCSLDVNVSDTIRNIFEQVDVEQRKLAEHAYLKYIANKIMTTSVDSLDVYELSFLHLKVCRTWKSKLSKEEALQKRIDLLESELLTKQRCTQQHIAELDLRVAEERRRLQEAREAVCRCSPQVSNSHTSAILTNVRLVEDLELPSNPANTEGLQSSRSYTVLDLCVSERRSAGDLLPGPAKPELSRATSPRKQKLQKMKPESRATLAKLDVEERRVKKQLAIDETPTRLRRSHERPPRISKK